MRRISNYSYKKIQTEQFEAFIEIIEKVRTEGDLRIFFSNFLSKSEAAYVCQRIDLMRMLAKNFSYFEIRKKLKVGYSTITNAKRCLDSGGEVLKNIILSYRYKPAKIKTDIEIGVDFPRMPGSII